MHGTEDALHGPGFAVFFLGEKCAPRSQNTRLRLDIRKTLLNGTIFEMEDNKVPGPRDDLWVDSWDYFGNYSWNYWDIMGYEYWILGYFSGVAPWILFVGMVGFL